MNVRHRAAGHAGFALVDLLVAIAVAGLAGSILVGLVAFVERNRAETSRRGSMHAEALILERVLRLLVDGAPPLVPGASPHSAVSGDENEVTVVSNGLPVMGLSQASAFRVRAEPGNGTDVVLRWAEETGQPQRAVLAQGISELALAYLPLGAGPAKGRASGNEAWRPRWDSQDGPLRALRLTVRFGPAYPAWVFVIPIEADLPAACLRNPRLGGCALESSRG
ncbi:type II secretion system protein [Microvirga sp. CF3016]|uniref:type II secretion system protein n=1 Tax=Microvirga sp. CF3016 TaxID=3110181 RepID=UPI002E7716F4|nr:hypothetical protein [Microvirga sp. CF3016]MEE1611416.1 hypothetical protein [Microvirga sp. CF3016]